MSSAVLHFCPNCDTLLNYQSSSEKPFFMKCSNCSFEADEQLPVTGGRPPVRTSIYANTLYTSITKAAIYDPALRLTCSVKCPNLTCESNYKEKIGTINQEGRLIQPEVCLTNHTNINRQNTYVCRICRTIFDQV